MSTGTEKTSRYRKLRGKSVSDVRRATVHFFSDPQDESPSASALGPAPSPPGWRRRSKTQATQEPTDTAEHDAHYPVPPIPSPLSQKEHTSTTRPKAAVMPPAPAFGRAIAQKHLRSRHSTQALTSLFSLSKSTAEANDDPSKNEQARDGETREQDDRSEHGGPRRHSMDQEDPARLADQLKADTDRLAEQKRLAIERLHQQLVPTESKVSVASSSTLRTPSKSPVFEKFGFFHRTKTSQATTISPTSSTTTFADFNSRSQSLEPTSSPLTPWEFKMQMTPPTSPMPPHVLSKYVTVRYRGEHVDVPITDYADTVDVLRKASELMKLPVAPAASNLHECCGPHGIERRLRRYERIDEVLSSWPENSQNSLVIRHACGPYSDKDLDISFVPLNKSPPWFTLQVHHCARPGKWNKRWVTLLRDGQMLSSKKASFSPAEKDCQLLCDLSCYDIYTPMDEPAILLDEGRASKSARASPVKSLKPPKRWIFAIRSQERPTTYAEDSNYVHFFCTDDPSIANKFQTLVHIWRSWYIVKTRRDAQPKFVQSPEMSPAMSPVTQVTASPVMKDEPLESISPPSTTPRYMLRVSVGDSKPLINLQQEFDEFGKNWVPDLASALQPRTPGTDSDVSVAAMPSAKGVPEAGADSVGLSSPSEQRRMRRDLNRPQTSTDDVEQQGPAKEGSTDITIAITEPQSPAAPDLAADVAAASPANPPPPARVETTPWFPSAAEHTARLRAEKARLERQTTPPVTPNRPATSSGTLRAAKGNTTSKGSPPNGDRRAAGRHNNNNNGNATSNTMGNNPNNNNSLRIHHPQPQKAHQQPPTLSHVTHYLDWAEPPPPVPPGAAPGSASSAYYLANPPRSAARHLEASAASSAPSGKRRALATTPSMPALSTSSSMSSASGTPTRQPRDNHHHNNAAHHHHHNRTHASSSASSSGGRPSTSSASSSGRPSTSSGGGGWAHRQPSGRGRARSIGSLRRGAGGPPGVEPPPPPPIPPLLLLQSHPALRDGAGARAPGLAAGHGSGVQGRQGR